jgi:FkbM family methyltransferase
MQPPIWRVGLTDRLIRALAHMPVVRRRAPDIATWFNRPEGARRKGFEVPFRGLTYHGEIDNRIDWCVYFLADYLAPEADLIERAAATMRRHRDRFVCYDIGANIGHMTLAMATIADDVVAFEPSPYAMARLREKISVNRLANVRYINIGLGEVNASAKFDIFSSMHYYAKQSSGGPLAPTLGQFDAMMKRGDEVVEKHKLPPPSFIRINAGDDYLSVLKGLAKTLVAASPILLIEPPTGYRRTLDEGALRAALYPNVELFTLNGRRGSAKFAFAPFDSAARRIVCLPAFVTRLADQEVVKMRSLKLACE